MADHSSKQSGVHRATEAFTLDPFLIKIVEQSSDFFGTANANGQAIFVNQAGQSLLEMRGAAQISDTTLLDYIHPEDRQHFQKHVVEESSLKDQIDIEIRLRNFSSGLPVPVKMRFFVIREPDSKKVQLYMAFARSLIDQQAVLPKETIHYDLTTKNKVLELLNKKLERVANIGGWEFDVKSQKALWTDQIYKIYGLDKKKEPNLTESISFYAPHEQERIKKHVENSIEKAIPFNAKFEFIDARGNHKWVRAIGEPVLDAIGQVVKLIGTFQDITAEHQLELERKSQARRLQNLFEVVPELVCIADYQGFLKEINPEWTKLLGYSEKELKAQPFLQFVHPDDISKTLQAIRRLRKGNAILNFTIRSAVKTGGYRYLAWTAKPDPENQSIYAIARDVTEKQKAIDEQNFILDTMRVGTWHWDMINNKVDWDRQNYRVFGLTPDDWNNPLDALKHRLGTEQFKKLINDATESAHKNILFQTTLTMKTETGELRYIGGKGEVLQDEDGTPIKMFGVNWDKTEELRTQAELEEQRQIANHNARLAAIGQLAAGVGHEINNPLAIIKGYVDHLLRKVNENQIEKEGLSQRLNKIDNACNRIAHIVKSLRKFSRSDSSGLEYFDIKQLVLESLAMMKEIYAAEGVHLLSDLSDETPPIPVEADKGRLQQVLFNVIANAKDSTESKQYRSIFVSIERQDQDAVICVEDNGFGVPDDLKERIFDPFFTTKEVNKGTGIGLSLSKSIIDELGGHIWLESEINYGTRFFISLPVQSEINLVEFGSDARKELKKSGGSSPSFRILLADDELELRDILEELLTDMGHQVITAENGRVALQHFKAHSDEIDLIISDIKMPEMNGIEFLAQIRDSDLKQPRFVFISGDTNIDLSAEESPANRGVDAFLFKPFKEEDLRELLHSLFDSKAQLGSS